MHREPRWRAVGGLCGARRGVSLGKLRGVFAEHQLHDPLLGPRRDVDDADRLAFAQHRRAIADRGDLDHAVRDEQDRSGAATTLADHLKHALGKVGWQRRRHLVEHQDVRVDGQRTRQINDAQRGQRQPARDAVQVQALEAEARDPLAERLDRRLGEPQVGSNAEIGNDRRFLVDRDEAAATGLERRMDRAFAAADRDATAVRAHRPGENLDERALPGAVRAHERVHLTGPDGKRGGAQREDGAVRLRDVPRVEQDVGRRRGHRVPLMHG